MKNKNSPRFKKLYHLKMIRKIKMKKLIKKLTKKLKKKLKKNLLK